MLDLVGNPEDRFSRGAAHSNLLLMSIFLTVDAGVNGVLARVACCGRLRRMAFLKNIIFVA